MGVQIDQGSVPLPPALVIRRGITAHDIERVGAIAVSSGFFRPDEVDVALELAKEAYLKGEDSGYVFIFADLDKQTVGFSCFGLIPCTLSSYDLYWIAVQDEFRGRGVGRMLLDETEKIIRHRGGHNIYIETSGMPKYLPSRSFYLKAGYGEAALLKDFYQEGDDKVIYAKKISCQQPGL